MLITKYITPFTSSKKAVVTLECSRGLLQGEAGTELAYALKDEAAGGWLLCWEAAKAMRARVGGNHSRVWSKMLNPLVGWRERADQNIVKKDPKRF